MNKIKLMKHLEKARELCLKNQLASSESYPDFALDFSRIGREIDKALQAVINDDEQE